MKNLQFKEVLIVFVLSLFIRSLIAMIEYFNNPNANLVNFVWSNFIIGMLSVFGIILIAYLIYKLAKNLRPFSLILHFLKKIFTKAPRFMNLEVDYKKISFGLGGALLICILTAYIVTFAYRTHIHQLNYQNKKYKEEIEELKSRISQLQSKISTLESGREPRREAPRSEINLEKTFPRLRLQIDSDITQGSYLNGVFAEINEQGEILVNQDKGAREIPRDILSVNKPYLNRIGSNDSVRIVGRIVDFCLIKDLSLISPSFIAGRVYFFFNTNNKPFLGYISPHNSKYIELSAPQGEKRELYPTSFFIPSPDGNWLALSTSIAGTPELFEGENYYSVLVVFDKDLNEIKIPYWESNKFNPGKEDFQEWDPNTNLGQRLHFFGWSPDSQSLFITWELSMGPPPLAGLGKVSLNGDYTDLGFPGKLAPLAISSNERFILGAKHFFGFHEPKIFDLQQDKITNLPIEELITQLRNVVGPPPDTPGGTEGIDKAYFSSDSRFLYFSIWIKGEKIKEEVWRIYWYRVDVSSQDKTPQLISE